jgi:glutamate racemase
VIACNTASVVALPALRATFDLPFVGVVPAVKTAAAAAPGGRFGVLATQQTVEGEYLRGLIASHAAGCTVVALPAAGLVRFVEEDLLGSTRGERLARVGVEVARVKDERIRTLVLGCTHFLHLEEEFREVLAREGITVVDSREGVARQVARLAVTGGGRVVATAGSRPQCLFHVTGQEPVESRYRAFAERFGLAWGGILP